MKEQSRRTQCPAALATDVCAAEVYLDWRRMSPYCCRTIAKPVAKRGRARAFGTDAAGCKLPCVAPQHQLSPHDERRSLVSAQLI